MTQNPMMPSHVQFLEQPGALVAFDWSFSVPEEAGKSAAPRALLLVNGFQRDRSDFRALRKRLHQKATFPLLTLSLDNRGCGQSKVQKTPLETSDWVEDVLALREWALQHLETRLGPSLAGSAMVGLLGISMGGMIAQAASGRAPEAWQRLILVSTTPGGELRVWPSHIPSQPIPYKPFPKDFDSLKARMVQYFGPAFLESNPLIVDIMVKNMIKNSQEPSSRSWAQAQHDAAVGFDGTSYLTHHRAPTLVVTGDQDQIIPPGNSEALVKHIKGSQKKVYPNVGHLILVEEPERFSQDVLNFLNEWSL